MSSTLRNVIDCPLQARAARRVRDRRVPGRPGTDDHGRRLAVHPGGPRGPGWDVRLGRTAQGQLDRQRLSARLHPHDAAGGPPGGPVGSASAVPGSAGGLHRGLGAGRGGPGSRPAHRRTARPGGGRRRPRPGGNGGRGASLRRPGSSSGARGHRRPDVPGHGGRAVPGCRDPGRCPPGGRPHRRRSGRLHPRGLSSPRRGAGSST